MNHPWMRRGAATLAALFAACLAVAATGCGSEESYPETTKTAPEGDRGGRGR